MINSNFELRLQIGHLVTFFLPRKQISKYPSEFVSSDLLAVDLVYQLPCLPLPFSPVYHVSMEIIRRSIKNEIPVQRVQQLLMTHRLEVSG